MVKCMWQLLCLDKNHLSRVLSLNSPLPPGQISSAQVSKQHTHTKPNHERSYRKYTNSITERAISCFFLFQAAAFLVLTVVATTYVQGEKLEEYIDYQAPPKYHYDYAVHDLKTHDIKSQWETRDHDDTKGVYTLLQPDGKKRIVEYEAGKKGAYYNIRYEKSGQWFRTYLFLVAPFRIAWCCCTLLLLSFCSQ